MKIALYIFGVALLALAINVGLGFWLEHVRRTQSKVANDTKGDYDS